MKKSEAVLRAKPREGIKINIARALNFAGGLSMLVTGAASLAFGFWQIAVKQKELGYIKVLIGLALAAGISLAVAGTVSVIRNARAAASGNGKAE